MWKSAEFVRIAVAFIDQFCGDPSSKLTILGNILCEIRSGASFISLSGGCHPLVDCYKECFGSCYRKTLVDYPILDVRFFKRCLQKNASMVFGTLELFSVTEVTVTLLKGAEHRDWLQSRQSL